MYRYEYLLIALRREYHLFFLTSFLAFFSGVTANLASFLVRGGEADRKALSQLMKEVEALRGEISKLHESGNQ